MKTNIFRVKEKNEKKIIIEEEKNKNAFLLFLKRHKKFILLSLIMLSACLLLVSIGIVFSLFQGSNDYDISYVEGSETINSNNDPNIDKDDIKEELLGEVARREGVVVLVKTVMSPQGDVISYYTDGTTVIVQSNGKIYRVSTKEDGSYGVDNNGTIDKTAKKALVTSTTTTLADGTIITYYSDGSAKVELKTKTIFVRDSNNIKLNNGTSLNNVAPSGVALAKEINKLDNNVAIEFTDKTSLITIDNNKYIVNKNISVTVNETEINYDQNNVFKVLSEKTYKDGNTITHYENGAATITDSSGNVFYVKKSGDILLKDQKLYEIITNEYGYSRSIITCSNGTKVTYFDNGAAVIIHSDGTRQYVEDNTEIIYDDNKNITSLPNFSPQTSTKVTTDGNTVINFENGKSQVLKSDGSSYITDTSKIIFQATGEIDDDEITENKPGYGGVNPNPGEGIYISEAENKYNDFKNIENTVFVIKNNNSKNKVLRITIEEISDYKKYNTSRLDPQFVKFQSTIGDSYIPATKLTENTWIDEEGTTNYIIYDGTINAKSSVQVAISLYVDYKELDNSYQNKGFIGTIKIYVEDDIEDIE